MQLGQSGDYYTFTTLSVVPTPMQLPSGWKATLFTKLGCGEREREREIHLTMSHVTSLVYMYMYMYVKSSCFFCNLNTPWQSHEIDIYTSKFTNYCNTILF